MKQKRLKTIVIGGGAAGLMAAGRAAECGAQVLLFEKMGRTGRKIGISGKGRCNLTNSAPLPEILPHFGRNGKFLRQCFDTFFTEDLIAFFEDKGLALVTERGGRVFPKSGKALDVVRVLNRWLNRQRVSVKTDSPVTSIIVQDRKVTGVLCRGKEISTDAVILATGGKSYPRTGSTGDGYRLAAEVGHTLTPLRPALVPLECRDSEISRLTGLNLRNINVRMYINGKRKGQEFGEVSFTGSTIGGPVILTMSRAIVNYLERKDRVSLSIDLKPGLDDKQLAGRLIRDFKNRGGEPVSSLLRGLMPYQLVDFCLQSCKIPADIDTQNFPAAMRKRLAVWLKDFRFEICGYRGFNKAIVTSGGISLKEINPRTMESRLVERLFIVGELLDIQGDTGGYNLQAAFSTGWLAGSSLNILK
ncbi:MAG: NAD(P)/FAD-dependent oxidoreductase [Deltaproteobacteria bacterium]|nr:NAD(P)/FAD-dependent oxidoreductase [Deltaproteobacteria bacterium]